MNKWYQDTYVNNANNYIVLCFVYDLYSVKPYLSPSFIGRFEVRVLLFVEGGTVTYSC